MSRLLPGWTLVVSALAIFMVSLDNLVVTNALTSIREDLGASLEALEWTVNAYTLAFAVFLLTGVALGPLVGGAVIEGISWQWIFWLNVPVGLALAPLAARRLEESHGPAGRLDLPGLVLASAGLLGVVYGVVRGNPSGWASTEVVASIASGAALLAAFVAWELRARSPMLPLRFFRSRQFAATNGVSLAMTFGIFGSIFLLAQFFQTVQGYSPLEAGLRTLPWTAMPMFVAPVAGILSDRVGSPPPVSTGLLLQAAALTWLAVVSTPGV